MAEVMAILLVLVLFAILLSGYPVAFVLAGVSLLFALAGAWMELFSLDYLNTLPGRIYGIMSNDLLIAVPLFVFMGITLERTKIAEELLETMAALFGKCRAGMGISVTIVGMLLAASTGIVGATVVTMGLISLPTMLRSGYSKSISTGTICAAGTLGQIIPPSIVLILLGDQISNSWQTAQLENGIVSPVPVTIADIFVAAIIPGMLLMGGYLLWLLLYSRIYPEKAPPLAEEVREEIFSTGIVRKIMRALLPPLALIVVVLGSILSGLATTTESAAVGAIGALLLAAERKQLTLVNLKAITRTTARVSSMVFTILIGATIFTLIFRGFGGEDIIHTALSSLPGGLMGAILVVMLAVFLLGFFLDFIEITFIVVPIVGPILLAMGADPIWLAILLAVNLQTSFLTPPFGFSLFYLRGVAPQEVKTTDIYRGAIPFVMIQLIVLSLLVFKPGITSWLPKEVYGTEFTLVGTQNGEGIPTTIESPVLNRSYDIDF